MADDKKLTTELTDELLNDDKLDNVAGGALAQDQIVRQSAAYLAQREHNPWGDERDIDSDNMSAAFINGDITGGEDF